MILTELSVCGSWVLVRFRAALRAWRRADARTLDAGVAFVIRVFAAMEKVRDGLSESRAS